MTNTVASNAFVVFLDLDKITGETLDAKALRAADWISTQRKQPDEKPDIIPSIIVVIAAKEPAPDKKDKIIKAGGFFFLKPEGYDHLATDGDKENMLKTHFLNVQGRVGVIVNQKLVPLRPDVDLSIYDHPPYEISDDDFKYMVERMNMSDTNPEKDD